MKRRFLLPLLAAATAALSIGALAATGPYDESADAEADVQHAIDQGVRSKRPVLIIFGANWCKDCRALDDSLKTSANAALMAKEFVVVKVDVGNFDRHLDIAERFGNPIKKGIPGATVLSPRQELLYVTRGGELADARKMSDTGIHDFFRRIVDNAKAVR